MHKKAFRIGSNISDSDFDKKKWPSFTRSSSEGSNYRKCSTRTRDVKLFFSVMLRFQIELTTTLYLIRWILLQQRKCDVLDSITIEMEAKKVWVFKWEKFQEEAYVNVMQRMICGDIRQGDKGSIILINAFIFTLNSNYVPSNPLMLPLLDWFLFLHTHRRAILSTYRHTQQ